MSAKYFALLTNQGTARLANATALGSKVNITHMAVGDGGGATPTPNPTQTTLISEQRRAIINSLNIDADNPSQIVVEQVIPEDDGGFWIREIGLYDSEGVLLAIANCPDTYKPKLQEGSGRTQTVRMIIIVSNSEAVTLKIDPSVVLATRKYADELVLTVKSELASGKDGEGDALLAVKQPIAGAVDRTQHDKNAEFITAGDFNAKGDGKENDSRAFNLLESQLKGKRIDLLGKTYLVDGIPVGNTYFNGRFIVAKTATIDGKAYSYQWTANAERSLPHAPSVSLLRDARNNTSSNLFNLAQPKGCQGFAISEPLSQIYFLYLDKSTGSEKSYVSRYALDDVAETMTPQATAAISSMIGHQGLSVENVNNGVKLWASVRYDASTYPAGGRQAIRFGFPDVDGGEIVSPQLYTLFGPEFSYAEGTTLPSVSYDHRFLVAMGRKSSRDFWVRVFDLAMLVNGGAGDYSDRYLYEWNMDAGLLADDINGKITPVQVMACDGAHVYIIAGNATKTSNKIAAYSLDGRLDMLNDNVSVGVATALAEGSSYEPEGACFYRPDYSAPPCLVLCMVSGPSNALINRAWALGYKPAMRVIGNKNIGIGTNSPQTRLHVAKSQGGTVANLSANALSIMQNDAGNVFNANICAPTDGAIVEWAAGPSSDYRHGRITYAYQTTAPYWALWGKNTALLYLVQGDTGHVIRPGSDATTQLGTAANRWSNIYAATATISTSDGRYKTDVMPISEAEKKAAAQIRGLMRRYRFTDAVDVKGNKDARLHIGVIAQDVKSVMESNGLNPDDYGFFCYDNEAGQDAVYDEEGNEIQPAVAAVDRYGIRYEEILCFVVAAL